MESLQRHLASVLASLWAGTVRGEILCQVLKSVAGTVKGEANVQGTD